MEWISSLGLIAKGTVALYEKAEFADLIGSIRRELTQVYADVADASFNAAMAAFRAARHSSEPLQEVRDGIAHLRTAYFTYQPLLTRTRTVTTLFFWDSEEPVLDEFAQDEVHRQLCCLATCISVTYAALGERQNAETWRTSAATHFEAALASVTIPIDYDRLRAVDKSFVVTKTKTWTDRWYNTRSETWHEVTPAGDRYLESERRKLHESLRREFRGLFSALDRG